MPVSKLCLRMVKRLPSVTVQAGQMSWHQMKQGFMGAHYCTCFGCRDGNSRPFCSVFSILFLEKQAERFLEFDWQQAHCLSTPEMLFHVRDGPSSGVKGAPSCPQTILDAELMLAAWYLSSFYHLGMITKGPDAAGEAEVTTVSSLLYPASVGGHQGSYTSSVEITTLQSTGWEMS